MVFTILRKGSRGQEVADVQTALNAKLSPSPRLANDAIFGTHTYEAVLRFQRLEWLVEDGEVGPCTWNALMDTETYTPILHKVPFIPQPNRYTCWAASTAMITKTSVTAVQARTPKSLLNDKGALLNDSESDDAMKTASQFAAANQLDVVAPASWIPQALVGKLSQGPLMFDMLWDVIGYVDGTGSSGHMIAVVGIRGDDDQSGFGTTLRIYDPWPPKHGARYSVGYLKWITEVPTRTYHIYQKR